MVHRSFPLCSPWPVSDSAPARPDERSRTHPSSLPPLLQDYADSRDVKLAIDEPKRRLIRDARVLCRQRGITQRQMADELGISRRTLEEWMQLRRMPQAPGESVLRQWVTRYSPEGGGPDEPTC